MKLYTSSFLLLESQFIKIIFLILEFFGAMRHKNYGPHTCAPRNQTVAIAIYGPRDQF